MLTGRVTAEREAVVRFQVLGPAGQTTAVEAAIDTGFDGHLTLPTEVIRHLGLPLLGTTKAMLGDGNSVSMALYLASVVWEEEPWEVLVLAAEGGVLVGMALLAGSRVTLDVEEDGAVMIESLATARGAELER
jgi:clan AA aspartic protease